MAQRSTLACFFIAATAPFFWGCVDSSNPVSDAGVTTSGGGQVVIGAAGSTLDFGPTPCGNPTAKSQTFTVKNPGPGSAHYQLDLTATDIFSVTPASGDVAAGATATVTVSAKPVPNSAPAAQVDQATLSVTINSAATPTATATLKRTASGATFTLSPATAAFGDVPSQSTSQPLALELKNVGNAPASVAIGAATDAAFTLTAGTGDGGAATLVAPGATLPSLAATFSPTTKGPLTATAPITVTGATCGASASSISLSGNGVTGAITVGSGTLDFGLVNCGATGASQTVDVSNTGTASITFTAALLASSSSPFTVAPTNGTIAANAKVTLTVTPKAIPQVSTTTANAFGDTLRINTNVPGDGNHDVTLTQTAQGAALQLSAGALPFNDVQLGSFANQPFSITNNGNLAATITFTTGTAAFSVTPSAPTAAAVGGNPLNAVVKFTPAALGLAAADSVTIATGQTDVLCSAPLAPITLSGNGINGALTLPTTNIPFGSTSCGGTSGQQTFDIQNTGTASFNWTAALGKGGASPYGLNPSSGTLAANTSVTITVTPNAIPQTSALTNNLYGDVVTITPTEITGGTAKTVTLTQTAKGGIVTVSAGSINFNSVALGAQSAATLNIKNTGTMPVTITPTLTGGTPAQFLLATPGATALAINTQYNPGPTFKPTLTGAKATTVSLAAGNTDVLCQPLPNAVNLSGTGTNGAITIGSANVTFAAQNCGAPAGSQAVNLKNTGNASLNWNASVLGATGFSVLPTSGTLAVNANVNISVKTPVFGANLGNVTTVNDTLRITTNAFGDVNHDVPLAATPAGAILTFVEASLPFGVVQDTKAKGIPITVTNSGNLPATVNFNLGAPDTEVTFSPQGAIASGGGLSINGTATFAPLSSGPLANSVSVGVPGGTVLCKNLPAALVISGTAGEGVFGGAPANLDFVLTCNTSPSTQGFSLTNSGGNAPYDFTATAPAGWQVTPANGSVPVNVTVPITVTPPNPTASPGNQDTGSVDITTDIPGDQTHSVAVTGTTTGAALHMQNVQTGALETSIVTGASFGVATYQTNLTNTGNADETINYLVVPDPTNPSPAIPLGVAIANPATADGNALVTYSFDASINPASIVTYKYTVYFPSTNNTAGVCSAQTVQTVEFDKNTS